MAKLQYPSIIETSEKFTTLADLGKRLNQLDKSQIMTSFVDLVPVAFLELLAEKWSVTGYDGWLLAESVEAKRKLIKREIIRQLGFGEVEIIEGLFDKRRDGSFIRDGTYYHGDRLKWAHYRVILQQAITNDQADLLRKTLRVFAPARCVLASLDYRQAALRHNGLAIRNGRFNRGTA